MNQRRMVALYLLGVHFAFGAGGAILLWRQHRPWILALEGGMVVSLLLAWRLLRHLQTPGEMVRMGSEWMREGDFTHSFTPRGARDLRQLVGLFNSMLHRLRQERTRNQEQESLLRKLVEVSPVGTVITDHDGRIAMVNPAASRLLGVAEGSLLGESPGAVSHPLVRQLEELSEGHPVLLELGGRRKLRCLRSRFLDRGFAREFFLVEDISHELWSTEKQAYRTVIRTLSHEVNNTLGATSSILQSLAAYSEQLRSEDRTDFDAAISVATERASHLRAFMGRYAEVARVPAPDLRPTDVADLVRRISRLLAPRCQSAAIQVSLEVPGAPVLVDLDGAQMEQALLNVLQNAVEAVGSDGDITLRLMASAERVDLVVEDSGPGLGEEARENLFVPFFSTKPDGQGIGLTLVGEILSQHRFDFTLDSQPGGPTRFTITMPQVRDPLPR